MDRESQSAEGDLARIADELLEHTRTLRRQHEELRDALAGVAPVPVSEPVPLSEPVSLSKPVPVTEPFNGRPREPGLRENRDRMPDSLHAMALQMCLAGETREAVKEQLRSLEIDERADEVVDEVFDRVETRRSEGQRRRLFTRRRR